MVRALLGAYKSPGVEVSGAVNDIGDDQAGEAFAVADNDVEGTRREVAQQHYALKDIAQFVEHHLDQGHCGSASRFGHNAVDHGIMAFHDTGVGVEIGYIVGDGQPGRGDQQVGDTAQRRNDHDLTVRD